MASSDPRLRSALCAPGRRRRFASLTAAVAVLGLVPSLASGAATPTTKPGVSPSTLVAAPGGTTATTVPPKVTIVAAVKAKSIKLYDKPVTSSKSVTLQNTTNFSGRHVFVVVESKGDWLLVQAPMRPNGRTGYVKAAEVALYQHDYAIDVSLSARTLTLYKSGVAVMTEKVAIGTPQYPTPTGTFFIRELARPRNPKGAYGPYAFGLSGYSNVLTQFGRGDGQIGIHGTNQPQLIGGAVSHGCIRMSNASITKLAKTLPQGVPVIIRA